MKSQNSLKIVSSQTHIHKKPFAVRGFDLHVSNVPVLGRYFPASGTQFIFKGT